MPSHLVLIVASEPHRSDEYANSMMNAGVFAFVFARNAADAASYVSSMRPDVAIVALDGTEGAQLCRSLRETPMGADLRLLLVSDRGHISAARSAMANTVVVEPASAVLVAVETIELLGRTERRTLARADRRREWRGGKRITDTVPED